MLYQVNNKLQAVGDCRRPWYSGLAFSQASLGAQVRSPNIRWPLFIWYYRQVAKDYPNSSHTVLRRNLQCLYASEALAAISLSNSQHIQENVKHSRRHYKNS